VQLLILAQCSGADFTNCH